MRLSHEDTSRRRDVGANCNEEMASVGGWVSSTCARADSQTLDFHSVLQAIRRRGSGCHLHIAAFGLIVQMDLLLNV